VSVTWWEWVSRTRTQRTRMMVRKMVEVGVIDPSLYLGGVASLSWEGKEGREGWRDGTGGVRAENWSLFPFATSFFIVLNVILHSFPCLSP